MIFFCEVLYMCKDISKKNHVIGSLYFTRLISCLNSLVR